MGRITFDHSQDTLRGALGISEYRAKEIQICILENLFKFDRVSQILEYCMMYMYTKEEQIYITWILSQIETVSRTAHIDNMELLKTVFKNISLS